MNQILHVNKNMKGFTLGLALKQRWNATWKSPIALLQSAADMIGRGEEGKGTRLQLRPIVENSSCESLID